MTTTPITGDVWGENDERARAFLLAEAEKPFRELRPQIEETREALLGALQGTSPAQAAYKPDGGEGEDAWGLIEIVRHLVRIETWITERIEALSRGERPGRFAGPDNLDKSFDELIGLLPESRRRLIAVIDATDGHENLEVVARHPNFGEMNCRGWLCVQALHEADHVRQIRHLKASSDFPAT